MSVRDTVYVVVEEVGRIPDDYLALGAMAMLLLLLGWMLFLVTRPPNPLEE